MTRCACAPTALTSVRFGDGVALVRCGAHDAQGWFVGGSAVDRDTALALLKKAFGAPPRAAVARPVRRPKPVRRPRPTVDPRAGIDEQLTALLRGRGLEGSWAVA